MVNESEVYSNVGAWSFFWEFIATVGFGQQDQVLLLILVQDDVLVYLTVSRFITPIRVSRGLAIYRERDFNLVLLIDMSPKRNVLHYHRFASDSFNIAGDPPVECEYVADREV